MSEVALKTELLCVCVCVCVGVRVCVFSGDQIEKNEMGRTRGACGGQERVIQGFYGET